MTFATESVGAYADDHRHDVPCAATIRCVPKTLGVVGVVGRFKPLHNGSAKLLEELCAQAEHVVIGIGSANRYNENNPFTARETKDMIETYLSPRFSNYSIVFVDDYGHIPRYRDGNRWSDEIKRKFAGVDAFVSGNPYVSELLKEAFDVVHPVEIIPQERQRWVCSTVVREAMARGGHWQQHVPAEVSQYIERRGLAGRVREEFGTAILAHATGGQERSPDDERRRIQEN